MRGGKPKKGLVCDRRKSALQQILGASAAYEIFEAVSKDKKNDGMISRSNETVGNRTCCGVDVYS